MQKSRGRHAVIHSDATRTVGNTPLVELARLGHGLPGRIVAKLEMRNPAGSVKDRLAVALIDDAERRGTLRPGMTIVEPTGGNTGIGLAFVAAVRGYPLILTMPEDARDPGTVVVACDRSSEIVSICPSAQLSNF